MDKTKKLISFLLSVSIVIGGIALFAFQPKEDPLREKQWYLNTQWYETSDYQFGETQVKYTQQISENRNRGQYTSGQTLVAIIDSGVDCDHEDLDGAIWHNTDETPNDGVDNDSNGYIDDYYGYDFMNNCGVTIDSELPSDGHGTAVAGIIGARTQNGVGIEGIIGNSNIKLMAIAVDINTEGNQIASIKQVVEAIGYAEKNGAKICNISLNFNVNNNDLYEAIKKSAMLFVVSSGNEYPLGFSIDKKINVPATYPFENVITVANLNQDGMPSRQSNYGKESVDILVAGTDIQSLIPANSYGIFTGTSFSTPIISGLAALIDQSENDLSASDIKKIIVSFVIPDTRMAGKISTMGYIDVNSII